jgi:hypothetical protein
MVALPKKLLDAALTGGLAYALLVGWSACSGGGSGGSPLVDGGLDGTSGAGGGPGLKQAQAAQSGGRLKARRRVGSDGSKEFLGWFDAERGHDCHFVLTPDSGWRCLPTGSQTAWESSELYLDPGCSMRAIEYQKSCPAPTYALLHPKGSSCGGSSTVSSVHPISGGPAPVHYFKSDAGGCVQSSSENYVAYAIGEAIPLASFVEGSAQVDP